ncbi:MULTISPECIES: hypothetical protein [Cyanophyceae]|uniref:hypothetical protein n=1 Tax=Cyanophyceae TaxID=3028117 RepID=UPI001686A7CE|nr:MULTISPECIES: hypothetical protein [Cyanophyceae]MBD1916811.1 hypothetical protein [Phormidium sp. FACHB-77]MBD2029441.1 hypothetical protein [Phormidium sp. FACHB-322]MBD2052017.1 hypothetical protein [Leptolyngbya sp. FACHB-60]
MQTCLDRDFKWNRLAFVLLATLILADTVPHPQLGPGLLQTLSVRVQSSPHNEH